MHTPWVERPPQRCRCCSDLVGALQRHSVHTHPSPTARPTPNLFFTTGEESKALPVLGQLRTVEPHPFFFPWLALCRRRGCVMGLMRQCLCSGLCDQTPPATPASYKWTFRLSSVILCLPHLRGGVAYPIGFGRHFFFSFTRKAEHLFI